MPNFFRTKDLPLAAYLFVNQPRIRFEGVAEADTRSFWFLFSPLNKAAALADAYFMGHGQVNPQAFASAQRSLKDIVFQKERQQPMTA